MIRRHTSAYAAAFFTAMSIAATATAQQPPSSAGASQVPAMPDVKPPVVTPPPAAPVAAGEVVPNLPSTYVIGIDDTLVIRVSDAPDINEKTQRVDPNGDLRLPVVGRVHAAGLTVEQLEAALRGKLGVFLQTPDVTVTVTSSRSYAVSVIGAVSNPGLKPLDLGKTLVDVLSAAGGLTAEAGPTVRVARKLEQGRIPLAEAVDDSAGGFSTVEIDAKALFEARSPEKNIVLRPNDVVAVPRADLVYVIGEVGRPGPIQLTAGHSISVMEAVSTSGGVLRTAAPAKVRVLRRVAGQETRTDIPVNLKDMMNGKAKDIPLAVGDILVVPDSTSKRASIRALEAAIQMGTMIGTYGVVR